MPKSDARFITIESKWVLWIVTVLLFLGGLGLRWHMLAQIDFDGLYGQDAYAYYGYGTDVKSAILELRAPSATYWPLGYPILLGIAFLIGGISPENGQILAVSLGALSGVVVFRLVYDYAMHTLKWPLATGMMVGLLAGLLLNASGQMLQSSVVLMSDVPAVFWASLSLWGCLRYQWHLADPRVAWRWLILASVALGMAAITRWVYGLLIIPWGLACLVMWTGRIKWRDFMIALIPFTLIVSLQLLHSRQNPTAFYDHQWLQTWDIDHATQQDFVNADGTFHYDKTQVEYYADMARDDHYLVYPLTIYLALGVVGLLNQLRRNSVLLILLSGWYATTFIFLVGIPYQNIRFALTLFPPLVIVSALGWGYLWQMVSRLHHLKWIVLAIMLFSLIKPMQIGYQTGFDATEALATRKSKDLAAIEWAQTQIKEDDAVVYSLNLHLMMEVYAPNFTNRQIFYETPESLAATLDPNQPTYILVNSWSIENQWQGKAPQIALRWIREQFMVTHLGRSGNYHLWRVEPPPVGFSLSNN